jgi:peptide/nickel transport system permease protein
MTRFLFRRLYFAMFSMFAATIIVFCMSRLIGDPLLLYAQAGGYGMPPEQKEYLRAYLGLDKPLIVQYFVWIWNALQGDLGKSLLDRTPVSTMIWEKLPATAYLALTAWLFAILTGVPLGIISSIKRGGITDYLARGFALFGQALPTFWIAIVAILIFAVQLDWLPAFGMGESTDTFWEKTKHFILPTITLGWGGSATYTRLTRSAMLEIMDSEFIKLARAKGVSTNTVIWKHAFRNALITGATVVELVFSWPGIGRLAIQAVTNNDFALLTGTVLFFSAAYLFFTFLADLSYGLADPRIRYD